MRRRVSLAGRFQGRPGPAGCPRGRPSPAGGLRAGRARLASGAGRARIAGVPGPTSPAWGLRVPARPGMRSPGPAGPGMWPFWPDGPEGPARSGATGSVKPAGGDHVADRTEGVGIGGRGPPGSIAAAAPPPPPGVRRRPGRRPPGGLAVAPVALSRATPDHGVEHGAGRRLGHRRDSGVMTLRDFTAGGVPGGGRFWGGAAVARRQTATLAPSWPHCRATAPCSMS